jgi:hypothetical protein
MPDPSVWQFDPSSLQGKFSIVKAPGVAQAISISIPKAFLPMTILKKPIFPQYWPLPQTEKRGLSAQYASLRYHLAGTMYGRPIHLPRVAHNPILFSGLGVDIPTHNANDVIDHHVPKLGVINNTTRVINNGLRIDAGRHGSFIYKNSR